MAHIALYRTWRSQTFREVVGQKHITQTLQNSLRENRLTHAYLFNGPRGTGKTSTAKILAKAVNCLNGPAEEPCNACSACERITDGAVMDVVEIDAASNRGVEEIRDIRDKVKYAPTEVRQKVYIIDEVHMLTTEAFNALLKTLEEPPAHVMFILATTEPHKIPATIISRCQRFDFRRVSMDDQVQRLKYICDQEQISINEEALHYIARLSDGGMRDALSLLDQATSFATGEVQLSDILSITGGVASDQFKKLVLCIKDKDLGAALELIDTFMQEGKSADKCIENLINYFRDLLMVRMVPNSPVITERVFDMRELSDIASHFTPNEMMGMIEILNHYQSEMKYSVQPQTLLEISIMKMCGGHSGEGHTAVSTGADSGSRMPQGDLFAQMSQKLKQLEDQIAGLVKSGVSGAAVETKPAPKMPVASAPSKKSGIKLDGYLKASEGPETKAALMKWSQVLGLVKEKKITVHAWFVNGDLVSMLDDVVLVAFKNEMHRNTTEKPENKLIIEQVLSSVFGKPMRLLTVMRKEWDDAKSDVTSSPPEVLELVAEEGSPGSPPKEEWISEAIQLFGEDLVTIKED
ncbi:MULTISPECIES: DNA polymerase III subunit gamma/tau [Paenibacillus]|uniref:DNA-directed DNA polymerase n=1 Tax=Paenibacillus violae TaxID=3077234 RepID=A0ABU3RKJ4_9BACL|nr:MULTISPECIES: DNA polymerase III subunit gamma/tau [Paenibacillus]MDU0204601.1 DNA polymerase III subunit gamma/tau [Paenibacillus sp. PFR10]MEC0268632.1 DNA polymerase III subunit gamma/tau [Paenibacillus anseongense]